MRFHQLLHRALVAAALLAAVPAGAQSSLTDDARGAWMLGLGAQVDEEEGESLLGTLYVGVGSSTWLTFVAGQSSSPADRANIEADTLVLGVDHRFDQVGFTLEASDGETLTRSRPRILRARSTSIPADGASASVTKRATSRSRSR